MGDPECARRILAIWNRLSFPPRVLGDLEHDTFSVRELLGIK